MTQTSDNLTLHVRIKGRVQGVWYRGWTGQQAVKHRLSGAVRNRSDGSVEAVFSGARKAVYNMLQDCRNGPPAAVVTDIEIIGELAPADMPVKAGAFLQMATR